MSVTDPSSGDWRESPKVLAWQQSINQAGCTLQALHLLQGLYKRDGSLLFALVEAQLSDSQGKPLLPYALLRGGAVVVVPCIQIEGLAEPQFLMVQQRRIAHGRISLEFPAGMLDERVHDAASTALTELEEETGLLLPREKLIPLSSKPLFSSPGLSDESIHYFACQLTLSRAEAEQLQGLEKGAAQEGEFIQVQWTSAKKALAETDSLQTVLGFHLFFETFPEMRSP